MIDDWGAGGTARLILNGKEQPFMDKQKFEQGLAVRREVLGDEYVDKAVAATTDFTRPMQELLN